MDFTIEYRINPSWPTPKLAKLSLENNSIQSKYFHVGRIHGKANDLIKIKLTLNEGEIISSSYNQGIAIYWIQNDAPVFLGVKANPATTAKTFSIIWGYPNENETNIPLN